MKDILIIGGGGHAKVLASVLKKHTEWNPIGYTEIEDKGLLLGLPYLGNDDIIPSLINDRNLKYAVIGIGQIINIESRKKIINAINSTDLDLPTIISENAIVNEDVQIEEGSVIMDGVILQPGVRIGKYSIINTGATIDHDCRIGDFVHIAPGVNLSGDVVVGNNVLIGTGAKVIQSIQIQDDVIIAAGSAVSGYIVRPGIYIGVPARIMTKESFKGK